MAVDPESFFELPQPAAVFKLAVLNSYLRPFASMTGSTNGRVCYFDGYAGRGEYQDGSAGSPRLALNVATTLDGHNGRAGVDGFLVEQSRPLFEVMSSIVGESRPTWTVKHGACHDYLDDVAAWAARDPLFSFIDPFGLGVPLSDLLHKLMYRSTKDQRVPSEVLMHVSVPAISRRVGYAMSPNTKGKPARKTHRRALDAALGGPWWKKEAKKYDPADGQGLGEYLAVRFIEALRELSPLKVYAVPVSDTWEGPPDYFLVLLTFRSDGLWKFNEAVSLARERTRPANAGDRQGTLNFGGEVDPVEGFDDPSLWIEQIQRNITEILDSSGPFTLLNRIEDLFGSTLGYARGTHVTKALKALAPNIEASGKNRKRRISRPSSDS